MATPELIAEPIATREMTEILQDDACRRGFLEAIVPEIAAGEWELLSSEPPVLSRGWRKRVLFLPVAYRVEGRVESEGWIVKLYGKKDGGPGFAAHQRLWRSGFRPPSSLRVPRPYAYSAELRVLIQENVEGRQWADYLAEPRGSMRKASARTARWLVQLQRSGPAGEPYETVRELPALDRIVTELSRAHPEHQARFRALGEALAPLLAEEGGPLVPAHGDLHPKNVLLADDWTTVIDFDHAGLREAGFDVGYAVGQLLVVSYLRHATLVPGAEAAAAFWASYREGGQAGAHRVCIHVARTVFQSLHFELCVLKNGRVDLLTLWPELIERWFPRETHPELPALLRASSAMASAR